MARRVELVPLDDLPSARNNPKAHDDATLDASIDRFGYVDLVTRDDRTGRLISGHGRTARLRARRARGEAPPDDVVLAADGTWLIPVNVGWSSQDDDEADAAVIALNRVGERGGWDEAELAAALDAVSSSPVGLAGVGFDTRDLDDLLARIEEREVPDPLAPPAAGSGTAGGGGEPLDLAGKQVRSLIFNYPLATYDEVVHLAGRVREARGLASTAEVYAALLHEIAASAPV